ncbi:uncharacterized protein LOC123315607 [Coccinella septempunctata]|uniref:uncharacterized protein LOC123315607 n=1 Tax=Coccinella septempunctata TaxID=41139 RepID=UPI001D063403|nr:uncharacterized protein LOC123315607 [Coccinella septempunctata]
MISLNDARNDEFEETSSCSPIICPIHHFSGCEWKGASESIMQHCISKHGKFVRKGYRQKYEIKNFRSLNVVKDFPHIIEAHGNVFILWLRKFPSGIISLRVHSMKCCMDPARYEAIITFNAEVSIQRKLFCYPYCYYEMGFDRLDNTKVLLNTDDFIEDVNILNYNVCIKDNSLTSWLSMI